MNWEETVITVASGQRSGKLQATLKEALAAQAEASFKAGVQTVVDWVEQHKKQRIPNYQKEEWGIKEVT